MTCFIRAVSVGLLSIAVSLCDSVIVGTANDGNCYPFSCNDSGSSTGSSIEYQQVYSASQFPEAMTIRTITFYDSFLTMFGLQGGPVLDGQYTLSLSTTSAAVGTLSTTLSSNIGPDSTIFSSGSLSGAVDDSFSISGGPFLYNPLLGNLLLDVLVTGQSNVSSVAGGALDADDTGSVTSRAYRIGASPGQSDSVGLVTGFSSTQVTAVPEPTAMGPVAIGLALFLAYIQKRHAKT